MSFQIPTTPKIILTKSTLELLEFVVRFRFHLKPQRLRYVLLAAKNRGMSVFQKCLAPELMPNFFLGSLVPHLSPTGVAMEGY